MENWRMYAKNATKSRQRRPLVVVASAPTSTLLPNSRSYVNRWSLQKRRSRRRRLPGVASSRRRPPRSWSTARRVRRTRSNASYSSARANRWPQSAGLAVRRHRIVLSTRSSGRRATRSPPIIRSTDEWWDLIDCWPTDSTIWAGGRGTFGTRPIK